MCVTGNDKRARDVSSVKFPTRTYALSPSTTNLCAHHHHPLSQSRDTNLRIRDCPRVHWSRPVEPTSPSAVIVGGGALTLQDALSSHELNPNSTPHYVLTRIAIFLFCYHYLLLSCCTLVFARYFRPCPSSVVIYSIS
ncbi:uncharacterized protein BT62DRAFT_739404 [Guyanagaster necrorhizus]|uniref:Uncharacterized protein n=1 Tax=Guyanagaster necrorhizus TaxID=856835 RepID=A0A9P8AL80_9AGAR|nr:uncharacterized protein BT62DRAFT_739404 [Guyanagaster necrorhizus MCA 3950]KAG7439356.1 hypothetical protein BT62DRAFT_739404 [Guyanagaster necrorhizus MCA 3950]